MAETTTLQAAAYTGRGTAREPVTLPDTLFDGTINMPVMHQAVKAYLANQRQGNASTKIRKYVTGGNQKPWKQKGTGRARQGSTRAPQWVGGGTVFGPTPRSYAQYVPRQVRALARKSALNARARESAIFIIDTFAFEAPKTARMKSLVDRLGVGDQKVLVLTHGVKQNVFLSGRNLPNVHVMPYSDVSTYHILWSDVVLIEAGALGQTLEPVAETDQDVKRTKPGRTTTKAVATAVHPHTSREKVSKKTAHKAAAKKTAVKAAASKPAAKTKKAQPKKGAAKKSAKPTKKKGK